MGSTHNPLSSNEVPDDPKIPARSWLCLKAPSQHISLSSPRERNQTLGPYSPLNSRGLVATVSKVAATNVSLLFMCMSTQLSRSRIYYPAPLSVDQPVTA